MDTEKKTMDNMNFSFDDIQAMTPGERVKFMASIPMIPCPEYDGITWPTFFPFRKKGAERAVKDIMNIQTRETDILLCTYAKSGTHWMYEITKMLLEKETELRKDNKGSTMLEVISSLSSLDDLPSPRVLDTHFLFKYLPRKHIENRGKIVHMMRNPKDVLVSLYYHALKDKFLNLKEKTWDELFEIWMSDKVPYGSWYDYMFQIEQAEKDYPGMIFSCYYEDMKKNPIPQIKRLAKFLGVDCSDQIIENIAKATSFENMQKNKFDISSVATGGKGFIYRKGEIGDWKNHFTVAQNERFDAVYKERMKSSSFVFKFE